MTKPDVETTLTAEERAFLMTSLWNALSSPKWTKDDLIDFGKALFTRQSLQEMPDKAFEKIYPFLCEITDSLGRQMSDKAQEIASSMTLAEKEELKEEATKKEPNEKPKETKFPEKKDSIK